ncbi:MAG: hypothetical protein HY927_06800 [Elusimicrobia bacterium]|nr:hypothetical protein [Elusimicrobiota bacterium]
MMMSRCWAWVLGAALCLPPRPAGAAGAALALKAIKGVFMGLEDAERLAATLRQAGKGGMADKLLELTKRGEMILVESESKAVVYSRAAVKEINEGRTAAAHLFLELDREIAVKAVEAIAGEQNLLRQAGSFLEFKQQLLRAAGEGKAVAQRAADGQLAFQLPKNSTMGAAVREVKFLDEQEKLLVTLADGARRILTYPQFFETVLKPMRGALEAAAKDIVAAQKAVSALADAAAAIR